MRNLLKSFLRLFKKKKRYILVNHKAKIIFTPDDINLFNISEKDLLILTQKDNSFQFIEV